MSFKSAAIGWRFMAAAVTVFNRAAIIQIWGASLFLDVIDTMSHVIRLVIPLLRRNGPVRRVAGILGALVLLLASACNATANDDSMGNTSPEGRIKVVVTTTLLGDLTANVGGGLIDLTVLVPPGADAHSFRALPAHSIAISEAALIVSNGAGLDDFLNQVLAGAKNDAALAVVASEGLDSQPMAGSVFPPGEGSPAGRLAAEITPGGAFGDGGPIDEAPGGVDPHFWMDPLLAVEYVERIREGLAQVDPAHAQIYTSNADGYIQELRELDQEIAGMLESIPAGRRRLVTFHDAYGYLARRYGLAVSAFVPSDASDVTPAAIVAVLATISSEGVPAVFVEPQFGGAVLTQAARDAGVRVGTIHSLLNDQAPTYLEMMRANARSLAENLN